MNKLYGGRYEIEEKIGAGGMAIVYKAKDTLLNRTVAIKVLREQFVSDEGFIRRFRREAQSAASLSHQNIVSIYDVGKDGENDYIVMEYVKGTTLKDIIRKEAPLPTDKALYIIRQIAEALAHAHANNIIHRDIKPQNILITTDGRIKVTDFGIARAASAATLTHTGDIVGSVHYLSPEQAKGSQTSEQSDIYSLGIILYELITGKVPYDGDTPITIALKHIQEEAELPGKMVSGLSTEIDAIIMKALAKSVQDRYKNARDFLSDLDKIQAGQTIIWERTAGRDEKDGQYTQVHQGLRDKLAGAGADKLEDTLHQKKRKKRNFRIIAAVVIVLALAGLVFGLWRFLYVPDVRVPDLKGLTLEQAELKLKAQGLVLGPNTQFVFSDDIEVNKIMNQTIAADALVKPGRMIDVTVSRGIEFIIFPDVTTMNPLQENAVNLIRQAGFVGEIKIEHRTHPTIGKDRVIAQNPAPQATWLKNSQPVTLYVSLGEQLNVAVMPNVTGYSSAEAKRILEDDVYKFVVRPQTEESFLYPIDTVISTIPEASRPIQQGSEVIIIISEGPGPPI